MTFRTIIFKKTTKLINRKFTPLWLLVSGAALEACGSSDGTGVSVPSITGVSASLKTSSFAEGSQISEVIFDVDATGPEGYDITFEIALQTDNTDEKNVITLFAIDSGTGEITFVASETPDYEQPDGIGVGMDFSSLTSTEQVRANKYNINVVATATNNLDSELVLHSVIVTYTVTVTDQPDVAVLAEDFDIEPDHNIVAPPLPDAGITTNFEIPVAEFLRAFVDQDTDSDNQITYLSFDLSTNPLPEGVTLQYNSMDIIDGATIGISAGSSIVAIITDEASAGEIKLSYSCIEDGVTVDGAFLTFYVNNAPTIVSVVSDVADVTIVDGIDTTRIDENTDDAVAIFRITVNDLDDLDGLALEYSLKGADANLFNVKADSSNPNIAIISFRSGDDAFSPDFEAPEDIAGDNIIGGDNVYEVTIVATDTLKFFVSLKLKVIVNDQNEAPSTILLLSDTIAENLAIVAVDTDEDGTPDANYYLIGDITVTDVDKPEAFNINPLVVKDDSTGEISSDFAIFNGKLYLTTAPDFETTPSYSILIVANDGVTGLELASSAVEIEITDIDEAPTDIILSSNSIAENQVVIAVDTDGDGITDANYYFVGDIIVTDPDTHADFLNDPLVVRGTDSSDFAIVAGKLYLTAAPDFETKNSYSILIVANEGVAGLEFTTPAPIVINVVNVDDPDVVTVRYSVVGGAVVTDFETPLSIAENVPITTDLYTFSGTDEDAGETVKFKLGDTGSIFQIDADSGVLTFAISPNFEDAPADKIYNVEVIAYSVVGVGVDEVIIDESEVFITVKIKITDVNDTPSAIKISSNIITENLAAVAVDTDGNGITDENYYLIGDITVTDDDTFEAFLNNPLVVRDASGGEISSDFAIVDLKLYLTTVPDYETMGSYSIQIVANDGDTTGLEFTSSVVEIQITDVNEAPIDIKVSSNSIAENLVSVAVDTNGDGTADKNYYLVGDITVTDPDISEIFLSDPLVVRDSFTEDISSDFAIVDGKLYLTSEPDFETTPSYSIHIVANDGDTTGLEFATHAVVIQITDVNEAPTDIEISSNTIAENQVLVAVDTNGDGTNDANYYLIGDITVTDEDTSEAFLNNPLVVRNASGGAISSDFAIVDFKLYLTTALDFETTPSYSILIVANDGVTGLEFTTPAPIDIIVGNIAELAVVTVLDSDNAVVTDFNTQISIAENVDATTTLYTFSGDDEDAGETVKFKLGATDGIFQIVANADGTASVLTFASSPNFEVANPPENNIYNVEVIAYSVVGVGVDETEIALSEVSRTVKIKVTDVNEAPTGIVLSSNTITENELSVAVDTNGDGTPDENYYFVGDVIVADVDSDTFSNPLVVTGTDSSKFEIVAGKLYLTAAPDYETKDSYSISIVANEGVTGLELASAQIDIIVENADDRAVVTVRDSFGGAEVTDFDTKILIAENIDPNQTVLYTFSGIDLDAGETVRFRLLATESIFQIVTDTGGTSFLTFKNSPNFEDPQDADTDAPADNIYSVEVIAYSVDGSGVEIALSEFSITVKIEITDVNEDPFFILPDGSPADSSIAGSFLIGQDADSTVILTVSATDPDAGDSLTYSTSDADFEISATGELSFASASVPTVAADAANYVVTIDVDSSGDLSDTIVAYVSVVAEIAKHQVTFAPQGTDLISFSDLVGFAAVTGPTATHITFTDWDMTRVALSDLSDQTISSGTPVAIQADVDDVLKIANTFVDATKDSLIRYFVNYDDGSSKAVVLGIDIDNEPSITREDDISLDIVNINGFVYLANVDGVDYVTTPPTTDVTLASYVDGDPDITYKLYYQTGSGDYVEIISTDTLFGFATGDPLEQNDVVLKSGAVLSLADSNLIVNSQGSYYKIVVAAFDSITFDYEISEISASSRTSFDAYLELLDPYFADAEVSLDENTVLSQQLMATTIIDPLATVSYSIKTGLADDGDLFILTPGGLLSFREVIAGVDFTPDFETDNQYTLTVEASYDIQGTPITRAQELTISINDVNEAPELVDPLATLVIIGAPIPGPILISELIALFTDPDRVSVDTDSISKTITRINFKPLTDIRLEYGDDFIDSSTANDERFFVIDVGITEINVRNFGIVAGQQYIISYSVEDGVGSESPVALLDFVHVKDSLPSITSPVPTILGGQSGLYYPISITEHYADGSSPVFTSVDMYGAVATTLVTVDAIDDDDEDSLITYSISAQVDKFTSGVVDKFVIDSTSGELATKVGELLFDDPDSQAGKEYSISIVAISDGQTSEAIELIVDINYLPEFAGNVLVAIGAIDDETVTLFTLDSTIRNASSNNYTNYEYRILSQEDALNTVVDLFEIESIDSLSAKVTLKPGASLIYDAENLGADNYTITVVASGWNSSSGGTSASGIDSDPLELTLTVHENLEINFPVTNLRHEKEIGDAIVDYTYTLTGSDLFSLAIKNGKTLLSYNIDNIDNTPATTSYLLTLEERDAGGNLVKTLLFATSIVSVNAGASYVDGEEISITEGTLVVGDVTIKSPIDGTPIEETAGLVVYDFIGDNDRQLFNINSANGSITFKATPDFENPFKTFDIADGETLTVALEKANTYNITVRATTPADSPFYDSIVVLDLVVKVTDNPDTYSFLLQDRKTTLGVTVNYKPSDNIESEITVSGIAGGHNDAGTDLNYHFIPAGTIILPVLGDGIFTITGVSDITVDPLSPVDAISNHPFEIIDGNLVIANVDSALNDVDGTVAEGGVKVDKVRQVYQVVITNDNVVATNYTFNVKLSPFNVVEFFDADTTTDINIFENLGTPAEPLYKVPQAPDGYSYSTFTFLSPNNGLLYLGDATPPDGLDELVMMPSANLADYEPPGGSQEFLLGIAFTLSKDGSSITEEVTKILSIEVKDATLVKPQDITSELVLVENSDASLNLKTIFPLALEVVDGYAKYTVIYGVADENLLNLKNIFAVLGAGTDQLSINPNFDFDYETTFIPVGHSVGLTGYSDGYLEYINTVDIIFNLFGTLADSSGVEEAKANLNIHLSDDTDEIVFVSSSLAIAHTSTGSAVFYVAKAVKESELSNPTTLYTYEISEAGVKFNIDSNTGAVTAVGGSPQISTFTVTATAADTSTKMFTVTISVDPGSQPDPNFTHKGYTDIYAVENEATDSMLYKIYNNTIFTDSYTLAGDDAQFFDLSTTTGELTFKSGQDSETGELTFKSVLDFENRADSDADNIYAVIINATIDVDDDGNADYSEEPISLNIHIVDIDDAPVLAEGDTDFLFVIGSDDYLSQLSVFTASDPDISGDVISYSIETGDDVFAIDQDGNLTFKAQPSVAATLTGQVKASSTGSSGIEQSDIIDFTVKVIDSSSLFGGSDGGGTAFEASDGAGDIIELIPVDYWAS